MPTIEANIRSIQDRINRDPGFGFTLKGQAILAIYDGFGSTAWENYMRNFLDNPPTTANPRQLARLTTTDGDQIPYVKEARAYLVGNAVCLPGTNDGLPQGINGFLDQTL